VPKPGAFFLLHPRYFFVSVRKHIAAYRQILRLIIRNPAPKMLRTLVEDYQQVHITRSAVRIASIRPKQAYLFNLRPAALQLSGISLYLTQDLTLIREENLG
jgi:hypothetical protein